MTDTPKVMCRTCKGQGFKWEGCGCGGKPKVKKTCNTCKGEKFITQKTNGPMYTAATAPMETKGGVTYATLADGRKIKINTPKRA